MIIISVFLGFWELGIMGLSFFIRCFVVRFRYIGVIHNPHEV
jgi:hypothetical protein